MPGGQGAYLLVLGLCLLGAGWLEYAFRTRVLRRWRRLLLTIGPIVAIFGAWDLYAIAADHWRFDPLSVTGITVGAGLPLEELLFFIIVPICVILAFEAVRADNGWAAGDEAEPAALAAGDETESENPG